MPKDNIERAIMKGASKDGDSLERVVYEAYGPSGCACIVDALTDNKNRTTQELKHLLSKQGIELAAPGAASWAFTKNPDGSMTPNEPLVDLAESDEEKLMTLLSALDEHDDVQAVYTNARGYESTGD
jgi:transcriptional/translational regulatory protein YebC/TACO1